MPVINRHGMTSATPAKEVSNQKSAKSGGYDIQQLKQQADQMGNQADDYKYQIAVELARSDLGDKADADDDAFKESIDRYYEQLDPTDTGRDQRGENAFTDAVNNVADFFDGAADLGGQAIDTVWDGTIGNLAEAIGMGTGVKDLFDADDASIAADALIDLGLSAIPVAGIPLTAVKNLSQNAPTISEALTGQDSITGEDLTGWGRAGAVGSSLLTAAGSVLPGVGKLRNTFRAANIADDIANVADDAMKAGGKAASGVADDAAEAAGKAVSDAAENTGRRGLGKVADRITGNMDAVRQSVADLGDDASKFRQAARYVRRTPGAVIEGIMPYAGGEQRFLRGIVRQAQDDENTSKISRYLSDARNALPEAGKQFASRFVPGVAGGTLGTMANTGLDPANALAAYAGTLSDGGFAPFLFSTGFGTSRAAGRLAGPSGGYSHYNVPRAAANATAMNQYMTDNPTTADYDEIDTRGFTMDELTDWLNQARGDANANSD